MDAPAIVDARLQAVLDALPYPAYAATNSWTVVAWNRATRLVFADYEALSGRERNIVWMAFTDPDHRRMAVNWEEQARSALALFRASTAQNVGEEWHKRFVADLAECSPEFRAGGLVTTYAARTRAPSSTTTQPPVAWYSSR